MMFAGAFGNAIDRIFRGFVIDYIQTSFINFPVFNIADIGITVGAILLVVYFIWFDKEDKNADVKINAAEENKGERLDKFIADNSDISRSYAAKLCEDGLVLCGEKQLFKEI